MGKNDRGKDFLFSDDCGFINGEDSDSYRYSDGSGYYHGADGSDGCIYSDGSAYYHGADGSDGCIYSDGSAYYHGADGTEAYKYSDGSGYYHGSDGSSSWDDDDSYNDGSGDDNSGLIASLVGVALGLGAVAVVKYTEEAREEVRREEERKLEAKRIAEEKRRKRQKEKKIRNKRIKALFFNKKNLEFKYSTSDLIGSDVECVVEKLKEAGFNNYKVVSIKDIYIGSNKFVGEVEQIVVNGQSWVAAGTMVPFDAKITITYHKKKEIEFPYPSRMMNKKDYKKVAQELRNAGFTEVYTLPLNDLKMGWYNKENSVKQVMIAGVDSIKKGMILEHDVKITIQYHSFRKK